MVYAWYHWSPASVECFPVEEQRALKEFCNIEQEGKKRERLAENPVIVTQWKTPTCRQTNWGFVSDVTAAMLVYRTMQ